MNVVLDKEDDRPNKQIVQHTETKAKRLLDKFCNRTGINLVSSLLQHFNDRFYSLRKMNKNVKIVLDTLVPLSLLSTEWLTTLSWTYPTFGRWTLYSYLLRKQITQNSQIFLAYIYPYKYQNFCTYPHKSTWIKLGDDPNKKVAGGPPAPKRWILNSPAGWYMDAEYPLKLFQNRLCKYWELLHTNDSQVTVL